MNRRDEKFILGLLYIILMVAWGIIKYTVFFIWFGTKWIWDKGTGLMKQKKRKLGIAVRTLSVVPILILFWLGIFICTHQEELKEGGIQAAWCIITKGKCITREIRQDMRQDMRETLSGTLINNTGLTQ